MGKFSQHFFLFLFSFFLTKNLHANEILCKYFSITCSTVNYSELKRKKELYYKKFNSSPYTGLVVGKYKGKIINGIRDGFIEEYNDDGDLIATYNLKNRKFNGLAMTYFKNGDIKSKAHYKNDKLNGQVITFHPSGSSKFKKKVFFKNDYPIGLYEAYFSNGQLKTKGMYVEVDNFETKKDGNWNEFYSNGKLKFVKNFKLGLKHKQWIEYDYNGHILTKTHFDTGKKNGPFEINFVTYDGNLLNLEKGSYKNDKLDGLHVKYVLNHNKTKNFIKHRIYYKMGIKDGVSEEWEFRYENMHYLKKIIEYINGKKNGIYEEFNNVGELLVSGKYEKDRKVGFWNEGNSKGHYLRDKRHGFWEKFKDGKLKSISSYKNGNCHGQQKVFYSNGNLKETYITENDLYSGDWIKFFKNGNISSIEKYSKQNFEYYETEYEEYNKNGKIILKGKNSYKYNSSLIPKNIEDWKSEHRPYYTVTKIGKWYEYTSNGKIKKITNCDKDSCNIKNNFHKFHLFFKC